MTDKIFLTVDKKTARKYSLAFAHSTNNSRIATIGDASGQKTIQFEHVHAGVESAKRIEESYGD